MSGNTTTRVKYWNHTIFELPTSDNNIASLGDWSLYSPKYYSKMKRCNVSNPNRLMISMTKDKDIYYIIDKDKLSYQKVIYDQVDKYVKEHTGKDIKYSKVKSFPECDITIYKLSL